MTTRSPSVPPVTAAADDYTYEMRVHVPLPQIIEALTDDSVIGRWWTVVTGSERVGDDVQLFTRDGVPLVSFTVEQSLEASEVTWAVTACVLPDWVGTMPSFSLQANDDGTCDIEFRHVGLRPAVECFDQCRVSWNHFMPSLRQFLETGVGRPNEPRDASA